MRRLRAIRSSALGLCALLLQGCAGHAAPTLSDRLVRPGKPTIEYGDASQVPAKPAAPVAKPPKPADRRGVTQSTSGTTVEGTDQRLAAALLIETASPSVDTHLLVAREYVRLRIFDAAEKRIEEAVRLDPARADAQEALARVWRDWGSPDQALGPAYRAVAAAPQSASAANTLGTVFGALGEWERAAQRFGDAAGRSPDAAWAFSNWCYAEFRLGHLADARNHCERAIALDSGWRAAHNNLGLVLAAGGDVDGARSEFLAAGDTATAEFNTGIIHAAMSDYDAAADAFERAIDANPDFVAAKARAHQARVNALEREK